MLSDQAIKIIAQQFLRLHSLFAAYPIVFKILKNSISSVSDMSEAFLQFLVKIIQEKGDISEDKEGLLKLILCLMNLDSNYDDYTDAFSHIYNFSDYSFFNTFVNKRIKEHILYYMIWQENQQNIKNSDVLFKILLQKQTP